MNTNDKTGLVILDKSMIGQKFNNLTVIGFAKDNNGRNRYLCQCDCGNQVLTSKDRLVSDRQKSCGCLRVNPVEKYSYLIGQKVNKWTVLEIKNDRRNCDAVCICECGTIKKVNVYNLINNKSMDCGCGRKQMLTDTKSKNLIGMKFGKLTVKELLPESNKFNRRQYRCECDCGNETIVPSSSLLNGHTASCGCINSYYNMYIDILLTKMGVFHKPEYTVTIDNNKYRYDFYLPDYNTLIEYDGEQHYIPVNFGKWDEEELQRCFEIIQKHDQIKNEYCKNRNINLLRIPYWEKQNIETIINNYLQRLNERGSVKAI